MKLTREDYEQLIDEDLAWLERMPSSLERQHIMQVLLASVEYEYPSKDVSND
jgi:hypothetical protein